jgi:plastocyanin
MSVRSTLRRNPATALPVIALAGLALVAAGCGSSNDNKSSSSSGGSSAPAKKKAAPSGGGATLSETATDFKFSQPSATAKAGTVTVALANNGQAPHAIEIEKTPAGDKKSAVIQPGSSTKLTVKLPAGKYEFYCPVDSHKQMGMTGELTVK